MHVVLVLIVILTHFHFTHSQTTCVPVYVDGIYPLYRNEQCAIESSTTNNATLYQCVRHICYNESWTAPCSNGQFVTQAECESGTCEKTWTHTCQEDSSLQEYDYGGTCTVAAQSGVNGGTPVTCSNANGQWSWAMTADACRTYAKNNNYVT